jgi:hypothetical protein
MTTEDFIITLFCQVDDQMTDVSKRPDAKLFPSEVVTLALLFALKGRGAGPYRWLLRLPRVAPRPDEPACSFFKTHTPWMARFLAAPTVLGSPTYG